MSIYYRPLVQTDIARPSTAVSIAGGWCWFDQAERLVRGEDPEIVPAADIPAETKYAISQPRRAIAGLTMKSPRLMGILNVTPDSFSDGGKFDDIGKATDHALVMADNGADILDIGGESTRPDAQTVNVDNEIGRVQPVISAIRERSDVPISIDTRKALVARIALKSGANLVNDVSALGYDLDLASIVAGADVPICLMHAQGSPENMQQNPTYDNVLLDIYDRLAERINHAVFCGIPRDHIIVDPGIGFGKTADHNLALIRGVSLFHGLGCPILLGSSRKRFIGTLANAPDTADRTPGSIALALMGIAQGVQITRVHDIAEMRQALTLWLAVTGIGQRE